MNPSKLNSSRCRPALGTLVRVQVNNEALIEPIFRRIGEIEKKFNFHDPESELSRFNRDFEIDTSFEFRELRRRADRLRQLSDGAFTPYLKEQNGDRLADVSNQPMDLGGFAKGFAVDEAVEAAVKIDPTARGFVEAGGDIRYFGEPQAQLRLRLGEPPQILTRELTLSAPLLAVASSSPGTAAKFGETKTHLNAARARYPDGICATVIASDCARADAYTKIVLFAGLERLRLIDQEVQAFVFDVNGQILESSPL